MEDKISKFLVKCLWVTLVLYAIRIWISFPESVYDWIGAAGDAISVSLIIMGAYAGFLWRINPFEKTPKFMGRYSGKIFYCYKGVSGEKETSVIVKQTLLSVKVQIKTNEITSNTIVGDIVEENGEYALYYTYITNPKIKYSKENPIQRGTCRLVKNNKKELNGIYWTSRNTTGDIELKKKSRRE